MPIRRIFLQNNSGPNYWTLLHHLFLIHIELENQLFTFINIFTFLNSIFILPAALTLSHSAFTNLYIIVIQFMFYFILLHFSFLIYLRRVSCPFKILKFRKEIWIRARLLKISLWSIIIRTQSSRISNMNINPNNKQSSRCSFKNSSFNNKFKKFYIKQV